MATELALTDTLQAVSYHEAAHAVACIHFRIGFQCVTNKPHKLFSDAGGVTFFPPTVTTRQRDRIDCHIIATLAGGIAQQRFDPESFDPSYQVCDLEACLELIKIHTHSERERAAYDNWLRVRAEDFVDQHWEQIEAVAQALMDGDDFLSPAQVRKIMKAQYLPPRFV
jgi:hypothetical protein